MPSGVYIRNESHREHIRKVRFDRTGLLHSGETKARMSKSMQGKGKIGALARWKGHEKRNKEVYRQLRLFTNIRGKDLNDFQRLEHKRFWNQRYKARKKKAVGSHTLDEWLKVKELYGNMCLCCKRKEPEVRISEDHIIPLSLGGSDYIQNIQPLCTTCNTRKFQNVKDYREEVKKLVLN